MRRYIGKRAKFGETRLIEKVSYISTINLDLPSQYLWHGAPMR